MIFGSSRNVTEFLIMKLSFVAKLAPKAVLQYEVRKRQIAYK